MTKKYSRRKKASLVNRFFSLILVGFIFIAIIFVLINLAVNFVLPFVLEKKLSSDKLVFNIDSSQLNVFKQSVSLKEVEITFKGHVQNYSLKVQEIFLPFKFISKSEILILNSAFAKGFSFKQSEVNEGDEEAGTKELDEFFISTKSESALLLKRYKEPLYFSIVNGLSDILSLNLAPVEKVSKKKTKEDSKIKFTLPNISLSQWETPIGNIQNCGSGSEPCVININTEKLDNGYNMYLRLRSLGEFFDISMRASLDRPKAFKLARNVSFKKAELTFRGFKKQGGETFLNLVLNSKDISVKIDSEDYLIPTVHIALSSSDAERFELKTNQINWTRLFKKQGRQYLKKQLLKELTR